MMGDSTVVVVVAARPLGSPALAQYQDSPRFGRLIA